MTMHIYLLFGIYITAVDLGAAGASNGRPLRPPAAAHGNASSSRWNAFGTSGTSLRSPHITTSADPGVVEEAGLHAPSGGSLTTEGESEGDAVLGSEPAAPLAKYGLDMGRIWTISLRSGSSGAAAGAVQVLALMWLKTAVNYQYRYGMDIRQAFRELWAQGGVPRFYQGLSYALLQGPLSRFGGSFSNELARELCEGVLGIQSTVFLGTLLGSLFSTLWRLMLMPIDTCKTVLQVEGSAGIDRMFQTVISPVYVHNLIAVTDVKTYVSLPRSDMGGSHDSPTVPRHRCDSRDQSRLLFPLVRMCGVDSHMQLQSVVNDN
jgi:hypothetical protein